MTSRQKNEHLIAAENIDHCIGYFQFVTPENSSTAQLVRVPTKRKKNTVRRISFICPLSSGKHQMIITKGIVNFNERRFMQCKPYIQ